ncbi:MAG: hypothetical protein KF858_10825 [Candidatus Sumerlaeia bacterium]|nr:hypothetical protein [Candidatus Sumerlaeia bacterium]
MIPDALAGFQAIGAASVSVDMMLSDYQGKNGVWQGLVLFTDCESPEPSRAIAVVLERADDDGIHGGLRIHYPGGMSEFSPVGPEVYHGMSPHHTWLDLLWVRLTANIEVRQGNVHVEAYAVPLDAGARNSIVGVASVEVPSHVLPGRAAALATSAQYGKGRNPRVRFDNLQVRGGVVVPRERPFRPVSITIAQDYLAPDLPFLDQCPELIWDPAQADRYFSELNRKLYRLKHTMVPDEFLAVGAAPSVRAHTYLGGMAYIEEVLPGIVGDRGRPLSEEEKARLLERSADLHRVLQARVANRHGEMVDRAEDFLNRYPDEPFREELQVARLHGLFHLPDRRDEYWALADKLLGEIGEGDLRDRVAYNRIVRLQKDKRLDQARAEIEAFLLQRADTAYRPLLLSEWHGILYLEEDWDALDRFARETEQLYEPGTRENWEARLFQGIVTLRRDGDAQSAIDVFLSLMDETPHPPDPHLHLPTQAAAWGLAASDRLQDSAATKDQIVQRLVAFPDGREKSRLLFRHAPAVFERRYPEPSRRLSIANPRITEPGE